MRLILASASPRRADLLAAAGIDFEIRPVEIDETPRDDENPRDYVVRLALEKGREAARRNPGIPVLAADTSVIVESEILGKPADADDAARMLRMLSGRSHDVITGVALLADGREACECVSTEVRFLQLSAAEIAWYVASGEPLDKAGGYAVQGLASRFVERIDGSYSNVVGLPVAAVYRLLQSLGLI